MIMHQNKVTLYCKVCTGGEDEEGRMRREDKEGGIKDKGGMRI